MVPLMVPADGCASVPGLPGVTAFKTGDTAWRGEDGLLYFAGRTDNQVKVRCHLATEGCCWRLRAVAGARVSDRVVPSGSSTGAAARGVAVRSTALSGASH